MRPFTGKELIRLLKTNGWQVVRIEGSHHILTKPGREETLSVPVHSGKTLKIGLVHAIIRAAGLEADD